MIFLVYHIAFSMFPYFHRLNQLKVIFEETLDVAGLRHDQVAEAQDLLRRLILHPLQALVRATQDEEVVKFNTRMEIPDGVSRLGFRPHFLEMVRQLLDDFGC